MKSSEAILTVKNLNKTFHIRTLEGVRTLSALRDVSFSIHEGETVSIIGESGCGKTTLGKLLLLLEEPSSGEIVFEGENIQQKNKSELHLFRKNAQMVFQNPFSSLNPRRTIESTLKQPLLIHEQLNKQEMQKRIDTLLEDVGISPKYKNRYPHQFSGGQRQRINIARALATNPRFVVCDEAVSALDVSIQAQILNLLLDLKEKYNLTYLFIAHDLATVEFISDKICVMYLGKIVEFSEKSTITHRHKHPYTEMLFNSHPIADISERETFRKKNITIGSGEIPSPLNIPSGCSFSTRCPYVMERCTKEVPQLKNYNNDENFPHLVSCHLNSRK